MTCPKCGDDMFHWYKVVDGVSVMYWTCWNNECGHTVEEGGG